MSGGGTCHQSTEEFETRLMTWCNVTSGAGTHYCACVHTDTLGQHVCADTELSGLVTGQTTVRMLKCSHDADCPDIAGEQRKCFGPITDVGHKICLGPCAYRKFLHACN